MKILSIGNSFSTDATKYFEKAAHSAGYDVFSRNIYIGGCTLERHAQNIKSGEKAYEYQEDSEKLYMISIGEALEAEEWELITVQQQSMRTGIPESYEPYLSELIDFIRKKRPKAKIVFHRTWEYEKGFENENFAPFDYDSEKMYRCIKKASAEAALRHGLETIAVGDAVNRTKKLAAFDPERGGVSLYRDGFHLSLIYGRYLAALMWVKYFCKCKASAVTYLPHGAAPELITLLKESADAE